MSQARCHFCGADIDADGPTTCRACRAAGGFRFFAARWLGIDDETRERYENRTLQPLAKAAATPASHLRETTDG